jgi:hypothetical protein
MANFIKIGLDACHLESPAYGALEDLNLLYGVHKDTVASHREKRQMVHDTFLSPAHEIKQTLRLQHWG